MAECGQIVEGNIVSFACDLEAGHDGPHRAKENPRSVTERNRWEAENAAPKTAAETLAEFQGPAQTTAERYTVNPTPAPGTPDPVVEEAPQAVAPEAPQAVAPAEAPTAPSVPEELLARIVQSEPPAPQPTAGITQVEEWAAAAEDDDGSAESDDAYYDEDEGTFEMLNPQSLDEVKQELAEEAPEPTKQREGDQPLPVQSGRPAVQDRIIEKAAALVAEGRMEQSDFDFVAQAMEESKQVGIVRYGTPLQTFNGRDTLQDALDEARDLFVYLSALAQAREEEKALLVEIVMDAIEQASAQPDRQAAFGLAEIAEIAVSAILDATGPLVAQP